MNYERVAIRNIIFGKDEDLLVSLKPQMFLRKPTKLTYQLLYAYWLEFVKVPDLDLFLAYCKVKLNEADYNIVDGFIEGLKDVSVEATAYELKKGLTDAYYIAEIDKNLEELVKAGKDKDLKQIKLSIEQIYEATVDNDKLPKDINQTDYTPTRIHQIKPFLDTMRKNGLFFAGLTLIGARTGGGKSVLAVNQALYSYKEENLDVCYLNLELGKDEVFERLYCASTGSKFKEVHGNISPENVKKINEWKKSYFVEKNKFYIENTRYNHDEIRNTIHKMYKKGVRFFIIDYLQIVDSVSNKKEWEQLRDLVRDLHSMTLELGITILSPVQINQSDTKIKDDELNITVRGSKELENSATVFLYQFQSQEEYKEKTGRIFTIKARNAERLTYPVQTQFHLMRILDMGIAY